MSGVLRGHHFDDGVNEHCVINSARINHRRQPLLEHSLHALRFCKGHQLPALAGFRFTGCARGQWRRSGVEERDPGNAMRGQTINLECDTSTHRMSRHGELLRRGAEHMLRHGGNRIEQSIVRAGADRDVRQSVNLLLPDGLIAHQTGKQQERFYARSSGRIGSLRNRLPVTAKMALATAGTMEGVLASPIPPGAAWLGTICTSTTGISSIRSTS